MAQGDVQVTICGNTTAPAELRFTPAGAAVASFTVAVSERKFDKNANQWADGDTTFYRCSAWRDMAENVAETLHDKGVRVLVTGRLKVRKYERDGVERTSVEIDVEECGPSLRFASAEVTRASRTSGFGQSSGHQQPVDDPWATPGQATQDPPF